MRPATRPLVAAGLTGVLALGLVVVAAPDTRPPAPQSASGDQRLARAASAALAADPAIRGRVSVVEVDGDRVRQAHFGGADAGTVYEVGSISKTFTAALYEEAVGRGEVRRDTRLGALLPLADSPAAGIRLDELASHRSGLPRLAPGVARTLTAAASAFVPFDPYTDDLDGLLDAVRGVRLEGRGEVQYSNLGFALLGQAVARAAGTSWPRLIADRITAPLGLDSTTAPVRAEDLPTDAPRGRTAAGREADPWTMGPSAPAGSIRSTPADLARWARALLRGTAPGAAALAPRFDDDDRRIGSAWFTQRERGPIGTTEMTWHNGGTGGFASMIALDRARDRAVVVLSDTAASVDRAAVELLLEDPA